MNNKIEKKERNGNSMKHNKRWSNELKWETKTKTNKLK